MGLRVCTTALATISWAATAQSPSADTWIAAAIDQGVDQQPQWRYLLHGDQDGDFASRVDTPAFFLHPQGARDPRAELVATLNALAQRADTAHPLFCDYPARVTYLQRQLGFAEAHLRRDLCPAYAAWRERTPAQQVHLVFASAYLGNPSSMFGHTLLRLDAQPDVASSALLSTAVNFSAQTHDAQGVAFALRGLTGGYAGRFQLYPYYEKVQAYGHIDQRDLWEYALNLNAAAIDMLMAHLWELRDVSFDYFFLDENCSLQLLALLQVALPEAHLVRRMQQYPGFWVLPVDTLRVVQRAADLLGDVHYRPSLQTRWEHQLQQLSAEDRQILQRYLANPTATWPTVAVASKPEIVQAQLAESLHDRAVLQRRGATPDVSAAQRQAALAARRATGVTEDIWSPVVRPALPHTGHGAARLTAGVVSGNDDSGNAQLWTWRPALHDELDPAGEESIGQGLSFFRFSVSHQQTQWRLHALDVVDIHSAPERDGFFQPWSWDLAAGYRRLQVDAAGAGYLELGVGPSWSAGNYVQLQARAIGGIDLVNRWAMQVSAGAHMAMLGRHLQGDLNWRVSANWEHGQTVLGDEADTANAALYDGAALSFEAATQLQLSSRWSARAELQRAFDPRPRNQIGMHLLYYY